MATAWKREWMTKGHLSTAQAGARELISDDGGAVENALRTAENTAEALARLVETLQERGKLTDTEVQHILDLHGYVPEER